MSEQKPTKTVFEILICLKSAEAEQRRQGLLWIGRRRLHLAMGQAVRLLHDPDADVRAMAAWALDQLSSPVTVPALIDALYDAEFSVRSNAGWALVHLAHRMIPEVVVPDVVDVLRDHQHAHARQMAFLVLNHIGDKSSKEAIRLYWKE